MTASQLIKFIKIKKFLGQQLTILYLRRYHFTVWALHRRNWNRMLTMNITLCAETHWFQRWNLFEAHNVHYCISFILLYGCIPAIWQAHSTKFTEFPNCEGNLAHCRWRHLCLLVVHYYFLLLHWAQWTSSSWGGLWRRPIRVPHYIINLKLAATLRWFWCPLFQTWIQP